MVSDLTDSLTAAAQRAETEFDWAMDKVFERFERVRLSHGLTAEQMITAITSRLGDVVAEDWAEWYTNL